MNIAFWLPQSLCMWIVGRSYVQRSLNWRGIQADLWPVTFMVRALARDPFKDPAPQVADKARIAELEKDLGIGPEEPEKPSRTPEKMTILEKPQTPSGRSLAFSGSAEVKWREDRDALDELARDLIVQYPSQELKRAYHRLSAALARKDAGDAWGTLRWMQAYVCRVGAQGFEPHLEHTEYGREQERYDELRKALADSLARGDRLMQSNARRRLIQWCARHHDPRQGRFFPMPDWLTYKPWKPSE